MSDKKYQTWFKTVILTAEPEVIDNMKQYIIQCKLQDSVAVRRVNDGSRTFLLDQFKAGSVTSRTSTELFKIQVHFKTEEYMSLFYLKWPGEFQRVRHE